MEYDELVKEIAHKRRSIQELISYITTKADESHPNYSLLLGAGASTSSGIRSGQHLVNEWRKDIYTRLSLTEYTDADTAIAYLSKEEGSWYSPTNEYSSLFEKKFDLAAQRRRFVENEVDGIFPSIGYSYLVSLASDKNKYIDTIYTTNFDDLINESFYQFSQVRPTVCAHDSSVNSLSISSTRPKIIKLHGDYLFDDIKSTLRETESLESNIKNKFTHFSKEFGLIVVGYAGNDRSIMDIINHLLKTDEYFKNGIYWCLRKGDTINSELRKLLWKDRVYFVEIDGFDQLLAEIHHEAKGSLSLQNSFTDTKREKIVDNFATDKYNLSETSEKIKNDIKQIVQHKNEFDLANLIREVAIDTDNGEAGVASNAEIKDLLEIDKLITSENFKEAESLIQEKIENIELDYKKTKFMLRLISIQREQNKTQEAMQTANELIEIDPYNLSFIYKKLNLIDDPIESCKFLESNNKNFENSYKFLNLITEEALENISEYPDNPYFELAAIRIYIEKSLKLNSNLDNIAWLFSAKLENEIFDRGNDKDKNNKERRITKYIDSIDSLCSKIKEINPDHLRRFNVIENKLESLTDFSEIESSCEELINIFKKSNISKKNQIIEYIQRVMSLDLAYKNSDMRKDFLEGLLKSTFIENCSLLDNPAYFLLIANYQLGLKKNKEYATKSILSAMKTTTSHKHISPLVNFLCDVANDPQTAFDFVKAKRKDISKIKYHKLMSEVYLSKKQFDKALDELDNAFRFNTKKTDYLRSKGYILLQAGRYNEVIELESELDGLPFKKSDLKVMNINIETAKKLVGKKINEVLLRNLIGQSSDNSYKICAESLLGNEMQVRRLIKLELSEDYSKIFQYKNWPAIDNNYIDDILLRPEVGNVA